MAHAGFESAQESVLETLTDLVHEHYLRVTHMLRVAVDREARLGASPFPDVVEQVFHEVGIGSVLALQRFWQVRIKDYHSYMLQVRLGGVFGPGVASLDHLPCETMFVSTIRDLCSLPMQGYQPQNTWS